MQIDLIQIGNSRGIRIPKSLIEQCGLKDSVNIEVKDHQIILSPVKTSREGWEESFKQMAAAKDDRLILDTDSESWDKTEWEW